MAEAQDQERKREAKKRRMLELREEFLAESRQGARAAQGKHGVKQKVQSGASSGKYSNAQDSATFAGSGSGGVLMVGVVDGKIQTIQADDGHDSDVAVGSRQAGGGASERTAFSSQQSKRLEARGSGQQLLQTSGGNKFVGAPGMTSLDGKQKGGGGSGGGEAMALVREQALAAYRLLRAQNQRKEQLRVGR